MAWHFFITISSNLKFTTIEYAATMTSTATMEYLNTVVEVYTNRGFSLQAIVADNQFNALQDIHENKFNCKYNPVAAHEHVAEIERQN